MYLPDPQSITSSIVNLTHPQEQVTLGLLAATSNFLLQPRGDRQRATKRAMSSTNREPAWPCEVKEYAQKKNLVRRSVYGHACLETFCVPGWVGRNRM